MNPLVLVVEDDAAIAMSLVEVLEAENLRALTARDGCEALRILESMDSPPGLILVDLLMPNMDGQAFLLEKARIEALSDIPVVVLTAALERATGDDIVGHLRKPFSLEEIRTYLAPLT